MNGITIHGGLRMVIDALLEQAQAGRTKTDGNERYGGDNLWGWLAIIQRHDQALAERVRQIFLRNPPLEAAQQIEKIWRETPFTC